MPDDSACHSTPRKDLPGPCPSATLAPIPPYLIRHRFQFARVCLHTQLNLFPYKSARSRTGHPTHSSSLHTFPRNQLNGTAEHISASAKRTSLIHIET